MALTGRKPLPAELIENGAHAQGSHKKSNEEIQMRIEAEQKLRAPAVLRCPKDLSPAARKEWRRVIKLYKKLETDILNDLDLMALTIYCEAVAVYKKAHETWVKYLQVVAANPEAQRVLDKCIALMEKQSKTISSFSEQLCLTPVGRARMGMNAVRTNEKSDIDKILEYGEDEDDEE